MSSPRGLLKTVLIGTAAGLIGTVVKSKAEPLLQGLYEAKLPPPPGAKDLVGADPADRPEQMPPAEMIKAASAKVGLEPSEQVVMAGSQAIHFTFGTVGGVLYSLLAEAFPIATLGGGVPAGLALYAGTHASTIPLLGIQPPPTEMPKAAVLWESTSHAIYGLTVEVVRRVLTEVSDRR